MASPRNELIARHERLVAEAEAVVAAAEARDLTEVEAAKVRKLYAEDERIVAQLRPTGLFRTRADLRDALRDGGGLSKSKAERAARAAWSVLTPEADAADLAAALRAAARRLRQ